MMGEARDWLPPEAWAGAAARSLASEVADMWARKWFARAEVAAGRFEIRLACCPDRPQGWQAGRGVATGLASAELLRLASLALGVAVDRQVLSEADRDIVARFARQVAGDLGSMLDEGLGLAPSEDRPMPVDDPFAGRGGLLFAVTDQRGETLTSVAIPSAPLVRFAKAKAGALRRRPAPLARLGGVVRSTGVQLDARLGTASLPLGELARLAVGDVLVLDRSLDDGAELVVRQSGRAIAAGSLARSGDRLALHLHS